MSAPTLFWLLIWAGSSYAPPVFLPQPFTDEAACVKAGDTFKASRVDIEERGAFACLPQPFPSLFGSPSPSKANPS